MGYSRTLLCLSNFIISLSLLALSSFTAADDAAVMSELLAAFSQAPSGWSASTAHCQWKNVNCSENSRVTSINLASQSLSGTLPSNLGSLTQLTSLSLQKNSFSGPLPSLANLSSLQQLYLDNNNFTSIPDGFFEGLTSLQTLTLSRNFNLAPWTIPTELTQATRLVALYAGSANVAGSLPDIFDSFASLKDLRLSYNNLTGHLPKSLGGSGIQNLWLNHQQNGLSGTIDVLSSMTQLEQVWLHENQFTGPIPDLSKCTSLFDLQLRDNQFTGLVPDSLMSLPSLQYISLANNELQGPLPAFPSSVTTANDGTNSYCKTTSGPCDSQVTILLEVAAALGYPIKLASSWQGNYACNWSFITCEYSQKKITIVNFGTLGFVGTISPAIANLTSLRSLFLSDNNLTGSIPDSLATLPDLQLLDVSNNNLTGPIPKFTSTVKINATGNPLLVRTTTSSGNGGRTSSSSNGTTPSGSPVVTTSGGTSISPGMIAGIATLFAGIGVVIVLVICCFRGKFSSNQIIYFWKKKRGKFSSNQIIYFWKKKSPTHQTVQTFLRNYRPLAIRRYSYSDIKKMTNFFKDKLGEGGYGGVYKGKLQDGCLVAVKVLKESRGNGEEFINEVVSISETSHINIVSLKGFCFEGSKRALMYEFMPNGSLEKFIYKENPSMVDRRLEWMTLYDIALGIARGLEYLHRGCNTRIVHFDIKPHNILLDENFCPKISDFGLAKICPREKSIISMLGARGTAGYIAPEVYCRNFGGVSHKSDVYSYGMMVFEMVGGRRNIDAEIDRTSEIFFPHWIYKRLEQDEDLGLQGLINENDQECAKKMIIVSLWCIQTDPSSRPSMSRVVNMLEGSLESLQVPSKPFLSSPSRSPEDSSTIMGSLQYDYVMP